MIEYRAPTANELQQLLAELDLPALSESGDLGTMMNKFAVALPLRHRLAWDEEAGEHVVVTLGGKVMARARRP